MSLSVRYAHKAWDQTIDDIGVCVPGSQVCGEVYNIGNPGYGIGKTPIGTPGQYPSVPIALFFAGQRRDLAKKSALSWPAKEPAKKAPHLSGRFLTKIFSNTRSRFASRRDFAIPQPVSRAAGSLPLARGQERERPMAANRLCFATLPDELPKGKNPP